MQTFLSFIWSQSSTVQWKLGLKSNSGSFSFDAQMTDAYSKCILMIPMDLLRMEQ